MPAVQILDQDARLAQRREPAPGIGHAREHEVRLRRERSHAGETIERRGKSRALATYRRRLPVERIALREQRRQGRGPLPGGTRRLLRILGVWTFFAIIWIWGVRGGAPFVERTEFFFGLFGLGWLFA